MGSMGWIGLAQDRGQVSGCCKCGYEPSVSIKGGEFLASLGICYFLRKDSAP